MCPTPNTPGANCTTGHCATSTNNGTGTPTTSGCTCEKPLLSTRSLLVFLCALFVGVTVGCLTYKATGSTPSAILAAIPSFAGAVYFANKITE